MNRRTYLKATTALGLSTSLAGCGMSMGGGGGSVPSSGNNSNSTNSSQVGVGSALDPSQYSGEFTRVVNMVKDAGADPTGKEDVSPLIQRELRDETLLFFPQGTYKMNSQIRRAGNKDMGIIGNNAVMKHGIVEAIDGFDVTKGEFHGPAQHFKIGVPDNPHRGKFVFGGFVFDWRGKNEGIQILNHHTAGTSIVQNVRQRGMHSLGCQGAFRLDPVTEEAAILGRRLDIRFGGKTYQKTINSRDTYDGGPYAGRSWATSGITMHPRTQGTLRLEEVMCGGWPDNGIYVIGGHPDKGDGTVEVINCIAANSQASNIRIGGENSKIIGCKVIIDQAFGEEFYHEQRPIRIDDGTCTVRNTRIIQRQPTGWSLTVLHGVQNATIQNVSVEIFNQPQLALVVSDEVGKCTVDGFSVQTKGWHGTHSSLFRGWPDVAKNISVNGRSVA